MFTLRISENTIDSFAKFVNATVQSNSLIISGPSGVGKRHVVEQFLRKQLSSHSLIHHNLLWIDASESVAQAERVRKINDFIFKTSYDNKTKYVVIDKADQLNIFASNSLLKILEEPTKGTIFILISSYYKLLPATIKSRCITVKVFPASKKDVFNIVKFYYPNLSDSDLKKYSDLGHYAPFRILRFIENNVLPTYHDILDVMLGLSNNAQEVFGVFDKILNDVDQSFLCYAFNHIISKAVLVAAKKEKLDMVIDKEWEVIERVLWLHPSMAELLHLEENVQTLMCALKRSHLSKQNVFFIILYRLIYR